jgi:hypothetical protein
MNDTDGLVQDYTGRSAANVYDLDSSVCEYATHYPVAAVLSKRLFVNRAPKLVK